MTATAQLLVWRKNSPVLVVALVVLGLASVGEGWLIFAHRRMALRAEAQLVRHVHELRNLLATTPAATNETATAIAADRARVARLLSAWQNAVRGQSPAAEAMRATRVPAKRTEAFFDLATFVEKTREEAARLDVRLRPDERFSFSAYAHQGPNPELIPAVFRQRVLLQHLLAALLEAHPRALLEFQRERPQPVGEHPAPPAVSVPHRAHAESKPASKPLTGDFFVLDPRLSLRSPQTVESLAFRLSFTGSTATLRAFLNRLADFDLPILIRVIEVEPAKPGEGDPLSTLGRSHPASSPAIVLAGDVAKPAVPLVARVLSQFTVTVEFVEFVGTGKARDEPPLAPAT